MARRTVTILSDDLDGKENGDIQTVSFSYAGTTYEIDLSKKNRAAFEKVMAPYLEAARKRTTPRASVRRSPSKTPAVTAEDRAWLRTNGFPDVKDRGRLSVEAAASLAAR